jgi:hypothetical protein
MEAKVGEPVLEKEDVGLSWQSLERVKSRLIAIWPDQNTDAWELAGQKYGFISGDAGTKEGPISGADDPNATPLSFVAAREDRYVVIVGGEMTSDRCNEGRLAGSSEVEIADADDGFGQSCRSCPIPAAAQSMCRTVE